jgi:hypothetical protein
MSGDGSGQPSRPARRVRLLRSEPVCRRLSEQDGSGRQAACHQRCLHDRRSHSPADISPLQSARRSRSFARRARPCRKSLASSGGPRRRSPGVAAQRRHQKRRPRVSRDDSAMARRASCSPPKAGEACTQRRVKNLCGGTIGWGRRGSERSSCCRPGRVLEKSSAWTTEEPAVGKRLEPGADRPSPAGGFPGRRDHAH